MKWCFGVEDYPDDVPVPAFSPRMVCTRCGMIGADGRIGAKGADTLAGACRQVRIEPIIPVVRREPFDDPGWLFELKWDGFRGIADTVNGRMLSKNKNQFRKFDRLLRMLPPGCVFDGEIVALDADGRPVFNNLLFGRGDPVYVAFDILFANGRDVRAESLSRRKALLKKALGKRTLQSDYIVGESGSLFNCVRTFDLEGIVAKRMTDPYALHTKWFKILNREYSQKIDRAELFKKR